MLVFTYLGARLNKLQILFLSSKSLQFVREIKTQTLQNNLSIQWSTEIISYLAHICALSHFSRVQLFETPVA